MSETKHVLYDLRMAYSGPFLVEDFYAFVDGWIAANGYEKEPKKKLEYFTKSGKKIEWLIELHKSFDELHEGVIVMRALFDDVREISVKKDGKKTMINNGDAYINIDGFIKSRLRASFVQIKPVYSVIRALIDRFIYSAFWDKWDGAVGGGCHGLFNAVNSFFREQKDRYK